MDAETLAKRMHDEHVRWHGSRDEWREPWEDRSDEYRACLTHVAAAVLAELGLAADTPVVVGRG